MAKQFVAQNAVVVEVRLSVEVRTWVSVVVRDSEDVVALIELVVCDSEVVVSLNELVVCDSEVVSLVEVRVSVSVTFVSVFVELVVPPGVGTWIPIQEVSRPSSDQIRRIHKAYRGLRPAQWRLSFGG